MSPEPMTYDVRSGHENLVSGHWKNTPSWNQESEGAVHENLSLTGNVIIIIIIIIKQNL